MPRSLRTEPHVRIAFRGLWEERRTQTTRRQSAKDQIRTGRRPARRRCVSPTWVAQRAANQVHRDRCRAVAHVRARTRRLTERVNGSPLAKATLSHTSPTGFSSVPPPGPATPVIPTPTSAPSLVLAPCGKRLRDLCRNRPITLDQLRRHTRLFDLRVVHTRRSRPSHNPTPPAFSVNLATSRPPGRSTRRRDRPGWAGSIPRSSSAT